ncbi:MAG: hypothetical protein Q4D38_11590 [Planctomycetia bacterium]|nr:hypothetical protein [Planctomycetia bacterium]
MKEYNIQQSRVGECCVTHRAFAPGENYYVALFETNGGYSRKEYCVEAWRNNPPENPVAVWKCRVPEAKKPKKTLQSINETLLNMFDELREKQDDNEKLFILALLLTRRRLMRLEDPTFEEKSSRTLVLYSPQRDESYQIETALPSQNRQIEIQNELAFILRGNDPKDFCAAQEHEESPSINPDEFELPDIIELPNEI